MLRVRQPKTLGGLRTHGPDFRSRPAGRRGVVLAAVLLCLFAAGLRLWNVSSPRATYWDEGYYALDAYAYLGGVPPLSDPPPVPTIEGEVSWKHPPLGKWLIAAGEGALNDSVFGTRLPSALFGVAGVLFVYLLALELWGSVGWAALAGFLLATDGLHIVQSRIAMLDIFLTTFVTAGAYFLVRDLNRPRGPAREHPSRVDRLFGSRDRLLAGLCLGAAVATKWSGAFALVLAAGVTAWALRRNQGAPRDRGRTVILAFAAVPLAVYLASYSEFFVQHPVDVLGFVRLQAHMLGGMTQVGTQPQNSPFWSWPLLAHPITYWPASGRPSASGTIVAVGNVALFWGFLAALPLLVRRAIRPGATDLRLILGFYAAMLLPWVVIPRPQFITYVLPCVPFMALGLTAALREIRSHAWRTGLVGAAVAAQTIALAAFLPVWLDLPVPLTWLRHLPLLPG